MKSLSEKQIHNRLNKYYKKYYGENYSDEWYVNPKPNVWKFVRNGRTIILECNVLDGKITEKRL